MIAYFNGEFLDKKDIRISPDDRGFLFSDGVYEVVVCCKGRFFRMIEHLERLVRSLGELSLPVPDLGELARACHRLIVENKLESGDALVYLQITRGAAPRKHVYPDPAVAPTVYATALSYERPVGNLTNGIKVILTPDIRWTRCDIKSISLLPNVMATQKAKEAEAAEALFVRDDTITEGACTSFAAVIGGILHTAPLSQHILPSVTRGAVLELCKQLHIETRQEAIPVSRLSEAEECMILGTTTEVMPVVQIDDQPVSGGRPGLVTRRLQAALRDLMEKGGD